MSFNVMIYTKAARIIALFAKNGMGKALNASEQKELGDYFSTPKEKRAALDKAIDATLKRKPDKREGGFVGPFGG